MSREAMEAVQDHSRFQSATEESYYPFRVLLAIASFADPDGVAGVPGEHRECPSHRAIADRAHVHRNTIPKTLKTLQDSGELEIADSGGAGRGSWTVYRICLPIDRGSRVPIKREMAHDQSEDEAINRVPLLQEMAQAMERMAHELAQVKELMAHENGTNGTRLQRERVQDTIEKPKKPGRETRGDPPPPQKPTVYAGDGAKQEAFENMASTILDVCTLAKTPGNRNRAETLAVSLVESGFAAEWLREKWVPWFQQHDWRAKKGEPPSIHAIEATAEKARQFPDGMKSKNASSGEVWQ